MSDRAQLQALLAISRALEDALTGCEFEAALRLQEELQRRLESFTSEARRDPESRPVLAELRVANARLLMHAEEARSGVLRALLELGQRRRAVDDYAAVAPMR